MPSPVLADEAMVRLRDGIYLFHVRDTSDTSMILHVYLLCLLDIDDVVDIIYFLQWR